MAFQIPVDQENQHVVGPRPKIMQKQTGTSKLSEVTNVAVRSQPERQAKKKGLQVQQQPQQAIKTAGLSSSQSSNSLGSSIWKQNDNGWKPHTSVQSFTIFDENSEKEKMSKSVNAVTKSRQPFVDLKNKEKTKSELSRDSANIAAKEDSTTPYKESDDCSPMVLDTSMTEVPVATLSEGLQVFETMLPGCYIPKIHDYLRHLEMDCRPKPHYMRKQQDITPQMRSILIDWLVEVAEEYKLHNETLFLAVSFIDRFLSKMSVLRGKLQLVGTAAMFIASKYEEIYPPDVGEFVYLTDDTYTKKQVLRMEQLILTVLSFRLGIPTASYFLQHFFRLSNTNTPTQHLALYLSELSLMEVEPYVKYLPSEVAAASLALARLASGQELWPRHLSQATRYTVEDLLPCMRNLHSSWQLAPQQPQQAIVTKYKSKSWSSVSTMSPPPLSSLETAQR